MHCNFDAIFLPKMFRELTAAIQKGIEEARKSSAESAAKLLDLLAIPAGERSFAWGQPGPQTSFQLARRARWQRRA